jgi:hypothetical protein
MTSNRQLNLSVLGYTQRWLDHGILTEAQLQTQLTAFTGGEDPHTEHYRYQTLSSYIKSQYSMNDEDVSNLLELMVSDSDSTMASSAVILLLKQAYLTKNQFSTVCLALAAFSEWTQKEIVRERDQRSDVISRR